MATKTKGKTRTRTKNRAKSTNNAAKTTRTNSKNNKAKFSLRKEVWGFFLILIAIILTFGLFGFDLGAAGTFLKIILDNAFGVGAFIPVLFLFYWGWNLLYYGENISFTLRGFLYLIVILFGLAIIPLLNLPHDKVMDADKLATNSGIFGNGIASLMGYLLGDLALLVDIAIVVLTIFVITGTSMGKGMRKAGEKASKGATKVKEKATEQIEEVKEHIEDWREEYIEERRQRKAYDQAKDPKYPVDFKALNEYSREKEKQDEKVESLVEEKTFERDIPSDGELLERAMADFEASKVADDYLEDEENVADIEALDNTLQNKNEEVDEDNKNLLNAEGESIIEPIEDEIDLDLYKESITAYEKNPAAYSISDVVDDEFIESYENNEENIVKTEEQDAHLAENVKTVEQAEEESEQSVDSHIVEAIHNPVDSYEGAAAETAAVSVSTEKVSKVRKIEIPYKYPPISILAKGKPPEGISEEVEQKAELLESTLDSFGIKAKIINATKGPAVTRYELEPARGVKVSKIVNLTDDIALNLAATGIRMEAPIPGKAAIGIEIPNKSVSSVNLRDVLDCDEFLKASSGIPVGLGKDIAGKSVITDLSKMPHLLVAGSTGSGKSVCINTLISSILFSRKPDEVKMILIDPKMVELSNYNGVPHLMAPVVTDMKKAASVLRWAVREMESRYKTFAETNVRDVKRYNELHPETAMPLVVIIIDELADLMMVSPADVEDSICRLAQMARAAGLHLVIATQRPSVDVITGTIKANVPSRISFAVSSQIDSRTILDMSGAEKLLGKGDMLFNPIGASKPVRIQGAFISDDEVERLVEFVKQQGTPKYDSKIMEAQESNSVSGDSELLQDELLEDAINHVMDAGQASASMLQRKLRIGFTRAGRLIDAMEDMKIIGPNAGSKPRDLLMTRQEVIDTYFSKKN